jgi:hypothetical protein
VAEGVRIVTCPFCQMCSMVQGERGIQRWQLPNQIERPAAESTVQNFFSGLKKARDLKTQAEIKEMFLVYLPYWRVEAYVAGWMFGRVKSGKNSTKPVEVEIAEMMHWNDAAVDVSEFGVHRVTLSKSNLEPYDAERLHAEAMVFEPAESWSDAVAESETYFTSLAQKKRTLRSKSFEKIHHLRQRLSLVYYPLWVARYVYRGRNYQVVVDGVRGTVAYGKAPGNTIYRAAVLVLALALGNLVLVDGSALLLWIISSNDDGDGFILALFTLIAGISIILAGYRAFRSGEEVEERPSENQKALAGGKSMFNIPGINVGNSREMLQMGMNMVEELSERSR